MEVIKNYYVIRAELKETLRDKVIFTEEQLDEREDEQIQNDFYALPQTPYTDHNGFTMNLFVLAFEGNKFKLYDNETSDIYYLEVEWASTDMIVEFLEYE